MGMEFPSEVKWLLPIVVGESWPEGDEDKLRELRDAWVAAAEALGPVVEKANGAATEALSTWTGQPAVQFQQMWDKFVTGDEAYFTNLTNACNALAKSADSTALDVEYTKYMIIASLIILAIQIAAMIAAAVVTFGGSTAGIVPAQMATRMTVQMVFKQLVQKMLQEGFRKVAMEILKRIAKEVLINVGMNLALDVGIQGLQVAKGDRKDWDFDKTAGALASGVAGGVVGAAGHAIPKGATRGLQDSVAGQVADRAVREGVRGAVEGVATTVGQAALTGDLDQLKMKDLAMGASAGAVDRASGGAKDQINEIKNFNADIRAGNIKVDGSPVDTGGGSAGSGGASSHSGSADSGGASSHSDSGGTSHSGSGGSGGSTPATREPAMASSDSSGSVSHAIANDRVSGQAAVVADGPAAATTEAPRSTSDGSPAHQGQAAAASAAGSVAGGAAGTAGGSAMGSGSAGAGSAGISAGSAGLAAGSAGSAGHSAGSAGSSVGSAGPSAGSAGSSAGSAGPSAGSASSTASPSTGGAARSASGGLDAAPASSADRMPVPAGTGPAQPGSGFGPTGPTPRPDGVAAAGYAPGGFGPAGGAPSAPQHGDRGTRQQPSQMPPAAPMQGYPGGAPQGYGQGGQPPRGPQYGPAQGGPPQGRPAPAQGGPVQGRPPQAGPAQGAPFHGGPPHGGPVQDGPVQGRPPQSGPAQGTPFHGRPSQGGPAYPGPVHGQPPQGGPVQGAPFHGQPPQGGGRPPQGGYSTTPPQGPRGPVETPRPPQGGYGPPPQQPPRGGQPPAYGPPNHHQPQGGQPYGPPQGGYGSPAQHPQQPPQGGRPGGPADPRWMLARPPEQPAPVHQPGPAAETPAPRTTPGDTAVPVERVPETQPRETAAQEQAPAAERSPFDPGDTTAPRREEAPPAEHSPFDPPQDTAAPARERSPFDPAEDTATPARHEAPPAERNPFDQAPRTDEAASPVRDEAPAVERSPFDPPQDSATPARHETPTTEHSPFDEAPRTDEAPTPVRDEAPAAEHSPFDPPQDTATPARHEAPPAEHGTLGTPAEPERVPGDATPERDRPVVDEPYIADPDFRTHDRADFDALGEGQIDTGIVDERTGRLTHEHEFLEALAMRDLDAALRQMTDNGAYAVHSYTSSEIFHAINEALRSGRNLDEVIPQVRALVSGLNEMPPYQGETVRRVNVQGEAAAIVAGRYEVGAVMVESQFLSSSRADLGSAKWPGDVEMIIEGKTGRHIESLASNKAEHEVLYKPGTQLVVKEKIEVDTPGGGKKWVIRLEEITPDDPRYLPPEAAKHQMDRNRELAHTQEAEIEAASKRDIARAFGGDDAVPESPPKTEPETGSTDSKSQAETPKPRKIGEPANGWGDIRRSSDVVGEPAIHARSTDPVDPRAQSTGPAPLMRNAHQEVRFLRDHLPEIAEVNTRGYYADGMPEAYRTNSAESVAAFELRMEGLQAEAQPGRPDDPRGRDFLSRQLGGEFRQMPDYNSAVREMGGQPVGSRAVLSVDTPDGQRAFSAVTTEHGVALVDPMTNRLADLPPNPSGVHLMQTHTGDGTPLSSKSEPTPATRPEPPVSRISELLGGGPERTEPVWNAADGNAMRNRLDGAPQQPGGWNPFRRSEQPTAAHGHQQPPPHHGGPIHQSGPPPVQHGWPQQQHGQHTPYQQGGPHQQPPVHNPYQQGGPHQQPPVHNPYQQPLPTHPNQSGPPPVQHGWPQQQHAQHNPYQQQGPFQPHPSPLPHQGLQSQPAPWSNMAGSTPLHNLPAIHAGTAGPHAAAYVAARHPELPNVNPNRNVPNAVDKGYWHNCTRCVVAYAQRLVGIDAQADPVLPRDLGAFDRMKWLEDQLGARWVHGIGSYDNAIAHVANMPPGAHSVVYVSYREPDGSHPAHVALAVNTPEGVVFIDPQNGGLMKLPTNPTGVSLLPFGSLATSNGVAANPQMALPHAAPHQQTANLQVPNTPVQHFPQVQHTPTTPLQHPLQPTTPLNPHHQQPPGRAGLPEDGTPSEPDRGHGGKPADGRPADDLRPGDDTVVVNGQSMRIDDAFQRLMDEHPELRDAVGNNPDFRHLLLTNVGILVNLITYPDMIPVVQEVWDEQLPMPNIPDHVQGFTPTTGDQPQPWAGDQPRQPQPAGFPPGGPGSTAGLGSAPGIGDHVQPGFDHSRAADPAYADAYLRDQATAARQQLDSALGGIANAVGGTALPATSPSWEELHQNLAGFDGDASRLTGLASAGMQVASPDDAYRAAAHLEATPGMEVLSTDDRLAQGGGLDMRVRTPDGTVGAVSMMPPMPGMGTPGAGGGTSRGGRHRKFEGPQQPLVEDVAEVPTPQYFKCFNKTYKVDRDGEGNLTGFLLNVRTGEFDENSAHLEKVLQNELPSNFRSLTEAEFVTETERERAFYLRGEGPVFALYATVEGMRRQAKEEGRALTVQEESFLASVQRRTFGMWEAQPAGFPCTSILA